MKLLTKVTISELPGPTGIIINTTPFILFSSVESYFGESEIEFFDDILSLTIKCRGQKGQAIAATLEINNQKKEIKQSLKTNGINTFTTKLSLSRTFEINA